MSVNERRLAILVVSWRSLASQAERGSGRYGEDSEEVREALSSQFRMLASMLEQAAALCAMCEGRGFEFAEAFEDEPEGWFECSMCKGSGRDPHSVECSFCGRLEDPPFIRERADGSRACDSCFRLMGRGVDPTTRTELPFGPHQFF